MAKMGIMFDGFTDLLADIDRIGGDLQAAVTDALQDTQNIVQQNVVTAAAPYAAKGLKGYATGAMYSSIISDGAVNWRGTEASIDVGFRLRTHGGFHSIFIMYGTPHNKKNMAVYNAILGTATKKQIKERQEKIMQMHLAFGGGK